MSGTLWPGAAELTVPVIAIDVTAGAAGAVVEPLQPESASAAAARHADTDRSASGWEGKQDRGHPRITSFEGGNRPRWTGRRVIAFRTGSYELTSRRLGPSPASAEACDIPQWRRLARHSTLSAYRDCAAIGLEREAREILGRTIGQQALSA